ncbi:Acetyltransferase (GNAT) family protein [Shimia gijangensis]|uniref:Acetyltransferase (GNAT) family protein n=1 Tax=Shimia gijangensis TaxID=1470563 RepID=A0A1M6J1W4_9RHOB|nr:GNAT family N-acetyltransferase [Shimia gijangensis]SHJ40688.1 Acetyltransferase (GNAT) family protein [Shimia gijangensis]
MTDTGEYFGNADQIPLMHRGRNLWELMQDNPAYSFYGRMVSLCDPEDDAINKMLSLARLQGAASCQYYPIDQADGFCSELEALGMNAGRYEQCRGEKAAIESSRRILDEYQLPEDISVVVLDQSSSTKLVREVADVSLACGVMPVPGSVMRGTGRKGVCLAAVDDAGKVVATASSYLSNHPDGTRAKDAFWGMLATGEARRGERIGLILGAQSIVWMSENLGARSFNTGITADNASSMALCEKLGVIPSKWTFIACIDPEAMKNGSVTR